MFSWYTKLLLINSLKNDTRHYLSCLPSLSNNHIIKKFDVMLGALNEDQIETLLRELPVGRIGCHADGITYVVPVNREKTHSHRMGLQVMRARSDLRWN